MNIEKLLFVVNKLLPDEEYYDLISAYHDVFEKFNKTIQLSYYIQSNISTEKSYYDRLASILKQNNLEELSIEHKKVIATMGGANYYGLALIDQVDGIRGNGLAIANFDQLHNLMKGVYIFYNKLYNLQQSLSYLNFNDAEEQIPAGYAQISFTMPSHLVKNDLKTFKDDVADYEEFLQALYNIYGKDSEGFRLSTIASSNPKIFVLACIMFAKPILVGVINPSLDAALKIQELIYQKEKNKLNIELLKGNKELIDKQAEIYEIMVNNAKNDNWEIIEKNIKKFLPNDSSDNDLSNRVKKSVNLFVDKLANGYDVNVYIDYQAIEDEEREQVKEALALQAQKIEALEHENQAYKNLIAENKIKLIGNNDTKMDE